jgi:hypothetical protein
LYQQRDERRRVEDDRRRVEDEEKAKNKKETGISETDARREAREAESAERQIQRQRQETQFMERLKARELQEEDKKFEGKQAWERIKAERENELIRKAQEGDATASEELKSLRRRRRQILMGEEEEIARWRREEKDVPHDVYWYGPSGRT